MTKIITSTIGVVRNGIVFPKWPEVLREQLMDIPDGTEVAIDYRKPGKEQTGEQRGYYRGGVVPIIYQTLVSQGLTTNVAWGTDCVH